MDSNIKNFYRNKVILITGGTGFLGKVLIEKILRCTEVKLIYILARSKNGKDVIQRCYEIFEDPLFNKVLQRRKNPWQYIKAIRGDCTVPQWGLSIIDRNELLVNVNVIIHCAATKCLDEKLGRATQINVGATISLLQMAEEMKLLKAFVHISSAFANHRAKNSEERFYTEYLGTTSEELLQLKQDLGFEKFDALHKQLLGKFPNTYCYTKAMAEEAVLKNGSGVLPICVIRSGIGSSEEPSSSWANNSNGLMDFVYGCANGVLRVVNTRPDRNTCFVPVDYCANIILASAWYTNKISKQNIPKEPPIYTLVPDHANELSWETFRKFFLEHCYKMPLPNITRAPFLILAETRLGYMILVCMYHIIPGLISDFIFMLSGKSPRMSSCYLDLWNQLENFRYILDFDFTFNTANTKTLWRDMTYEDRKIFRFDMGSLNWSGYLKKLLVDCKDLQITKAKNNNGTDDKRKLKTFVILNYILHGLAFVAFICMSRFITN